MEKRRISLVLTILSIVIAIAGMYLLSWLQTEKLYSQAEWFPFYKWGVLPAFGLCSFIFGYLEPAAPWRWPLLMVYVNYFSGFWIMKYWGQIPPFELILMGVFAVPMIVAGYLGAFLKKKVISGENVA